MWVRSPQPAPFIMITITYVNGFKNRYYGNIQMGESPISGMMFIKASWCAEYGGINCTDFMEYESIASIIGSEDVKPSEEDRGLF